MPKRPVRTSPPPSVHPKRAITALLLVAAAYVFALQLLSLYVYPVADSVRWGGDETWLMREFGHQATHGAMEYPESFGGAPRTDGILAGSMWIDAVVYGVPGVIFFPAIDFVAIGRTVTAALSLLMLVSLYYLGRKLQIEPLLCAAALLLIVATPGFVWATHSARYDILTGLTLLWYLFILSQHIGNRALSLARWYLLGAASVLLLIFSRHLLTLAAPATLYFLYEKRVWRSLRELAVFLIGCLSSAIVLSVAYVVGTREFSLFGNGGASGSYGFVLTQIPALRPFSRNVQISNLLERTHLLWSDGRGILYLVVVAGLMVLAYKLYQLTLKQQSKVLQIPTQSDQRFIVAATALSLLSWLIFQGNRPYYLFHIVPVVVLSGAILYQWFDDVVKTYRFGWLAGAALMLAGTVFQIRQVIPDDSFAKEIHQEQSSTIGQFLAHIDSTNSRPQRILVDVAGLNTALTHRQDDILTLDMFQPPPDPTAAWSKLLANKIDYVILRSSPVSAPFEPGRAMLPLVLRNNGTTVDAVAGFFYDDGRQYEDPKGSTERAFSGPLERALAQGRDTLTLYKVSSSRP